VNPCRGALVILVESRLVMCDKDESRWTDHAWDWQAVWPREFVAIVVPFMETRFVLFPAADESAAIFNNVVPLMTINIHSIRGLPVLPAKSS
jgi:hypothetical protein